jgi:hypothetical protein
MIFSKVNPAEKRSMLAEIYGEAIFLVIPFFALIFITIIKNSTSLTSIISSLLLTTDWSLMSAVVFGQCAYKMSRVIPICGINVDGRRFTLYLAIRILLIFFSLFMYAAMVFKPHIYLGCFQIILFSISVFLFFKDSLASNILFYRYKK